MLEQRKLERFKLSVLTRVMVITSGKKSEMLELYTENICSKGAYFKTGHPIHEGARVELDFVLFVNKLVKLLGVYSFVKIAGTVMRSGSGGIAVNFDKGYEIMPYRYVKIKL